MQVTVQDNTSDFSTLDQQPTQQAEQQADQQPDQQSAQVYTYSNVFQTEQQQQDVVAYLSSEILDVRDGSDRADLVTKWQKWRRQRRSRPEHDRRNSPWTNASNLTPPLTAQKVNTIFAKEIAAFAFKKPPVTVDVVDPEWESHAEALERFFSSIASNTNGLNMQKVFQTAFYEQISLGTEFVKIPFLVERWAFKRKNPLTGQVEQVTYVKHQGPAVQPIRLEDFFIRPYWKDIQRAPWVAIRYRYYRHELLQQVAMGAFDKDAVDLVMSMPLTKYDDSLDASQTLRSITPGAIGKREDTQEFEIYECYAFRDIDGDGIAEDVKVWLHPETGAVLRSEFNPLSMRDIAVLCYLDDPDVIYGVGVCEMTESLQDEDTTLHNMRIDGTSLAMQKVWAARRGIGLKNEEISPLAVIEMDDPQADLNVISFPDVAPSCLSGEMIVQQYADRITGANDYMAGFNDQTVGTSATVGGTMFLAQQANSILNSILQNTEITVSMIYQIILYQCIANKDLLDISFMSLSDQQLLQQIFALNVEDIPTKFRFLVKTTDITKTEESKKQGYLAMTQAYTMYVEKTLQLLMMMQQAQMLPNPSVLQDFTLSAYVGSTDFMKKMMEAFDVGAPTDYLPFIDDIKMQLEQADKLRAQQLGATPQSPVATQGGSYAQQPGATTGQGTGPGPGPVQGQVPNGGQGVLNPNGTGQAYSPNGQ